MIMCDNCEGSTSSVLTCPAKKNSQSGFAVIVYISYIPYYGIILGMYLYHMPNDTCFCIIIIKWLCNHAVVGPQVRINCPLQGSVATVTTLIHFMDLLAVAIHHGCRHA